MDKPLVLITLAYTIGIVIAKNLAVPLDLAVAMLLLFLSLSLYALFNKINISWLLLLVFLFLGMFFFQFRGLTAQNKLFSYADGKYLTITGFIAEPPKQSESSLYFPFRVDEPADGMVFVFLKGDKGSLVYGSRLKIRGVLEKKSGVSNPLMPEMADQLSLSASFYEVLPGNMGNIFKQWAIWISQQFNDGLLRILPEKEASLLGSILLGSSVSPLSSDTKDIYRQAGLIHLLVVSGTQVSILVGICLAGTRAIALPLWLAVTITSFFNLMLVIVTGAGASIMRAAIMGEVALIGMLFERNNDVYNSLSLSALILLFFDPSALFDLGFQLSFAATWALLYLVPVLEEKMPQLLALSLGPILATSPIIAFNMSQLTFGAIISNLLVLPWVESLVILGLIAVLASFIFLPLGEILGGTIWLMLTLLDAVAKIIAALPGACVYIVAPSIALVIGYYLLLLVGTELVKKEQKLIIDRKRGSILIVLLVAVLVWDKVFTFQAFQSGEMTVSFIDVGQGDCILIEMPQGKKILIDGGGKENFNAEKKDGDAIGKRIVVPFLHRRGINRLDMVILTHPHQDHLGGLNEVLGSIKVDEVFDSGQANDSQAYNNFKSIIAANKIKYHIVKAGERIQHSPQLSLQFFNPIAPLLGDTNSDSIVARLVYGDISFLFTGDMEKEGEERVFARFNSILRSTVLKVGHHGSLTSTTSDFLRAVAPKVAVISVGEHNRYRHPGRLTVQNLQKAGVIVYRTDQDGAITIKTDGKRFITEQQKRSRSPRTDLLSFGWQGHGIRPHLLLLG